MELIYTYAIIFAILALVGCAMKFSNKLFGDVLYIKRYTPEEDRIANDFLVVGLFRCVFRFRFFYYINMGKDRSNI